jgi:hypothetical protein
MAARAEGTVLFGLDGKHYDIDLSPDHAKELRASPGPLYRGRPEGHRHRPVGKLERAQDSGKREQHQQYRGTQLSQGTRA